jgi:hypothetical protein
MKNECIRNREVAWKVFDIPVYGTVTEPKDNENSSSHICFAVTPKRKSRNLDVAIGKRRRNIN